MCHHSLTYTGNEISVQREAIGTGAREGTGGIPAAVGAAGVLGAFVDVCQRARLEVWA